MGKKPKKFRWQYEDQWDETPKVGITPYSASTAVVQFSLDFGIIVVKLTLPRFNQLLAKVNSTNYAGMLSNVYTYQGVVHRLRSQSSNQYNVGFLLQFFLHSGLNISVKILENNLQLS